ncbi:MAG: carbohydrate ABC transporter substrate-binding protein [Actinobacteria bacterium]|nr:carbohydrate ABC transporter substrate-binding protein [Actinomycetota bacterium]
MTDSNASRGIDRRRFLRIVGGTGIGIAAGGIFAACGGTSSPTTTAGVTSTIAGATSIPGTTAIPVGTYPGVDLLKFHAWDFQPDVIEQHLKNWTARSGVAVDLSVTPNVGYSADLQTRMRGGEKLDLFYNFVPQSQDYVVNGWSQDLSDLPDVDQMLAEMYPSSREKYTTKNGMVISVPYFSAVHSVQYNTRHLADAGLSLPTSFSEIFDQCQTLKASGIASPYTAFWIKQFTEEYFLTYLLAEGIVPYGDNGEPVFADDSRTADVLAWWQSMYQEGLTPASILTDDPGKSSLLMSEGKATFYTMHNYFLKLIRDLDGPETANIEMAPKMHGPTGKTLQIGEVVQMGTKTSGDARNAAWDLMKVYGWKNPQGEYDVLKSWATAAGLGAPYPGFWTDPKVIAAYPDYMPMALISDIFESGSDVVGARSLPWYGDFQIDVGDRIHKMILNQVTPEETVALLAEDAVARSEGRGGL